MKRAIRVLTVMLVVLEAVLPCGKWGLQRIGYTLEPFSYVGYAWLLAVISAVVLFLRLFKKDESDGVLCVFLMPLSLLDALAYTSFFRTSSLHPQKSAWTTIALLICVLCSASITVVYGKPKIGRILVEIISVLLVLLIGFVGFVSLFSARTVEQSVSSPEGTRRAEIINVDQGALGGATFVEVYENRGLNLLLFTVAPKSKRVYEGGWADTFDMQLTWKDEEHLVITKRFDYVSGEEFTDIEINLNTVE